VLQNEELRLELDGLRSLVRLKNKELGTIKRLAAVILKQRTEVETFFLEVLSEVKAEIAQRKKAAAALTASSLKTPLDRSGISVAVSPMRPVGTSASSATNASNNTFAGAANASAGGMMTPQTGKSSVRGLPPSAMAGLAGRSGPLVSPPNPLRPAAMTISLPDGATSLPPGTTLPALVQHGTKGTHMAPSNSSNNAIGTAGAAAASAFGMGFSLGTPTPGASRPPLMTPALGSSMSAGNLMLGAPTPLRPAPGDPTMGGKISPSASLTLPPGSSVGGPHGMLLPASASAGSLDLLGSPYGPHGGGFGASRNGLTGTAGGGLTQMQQALASMTDDGRPLQPLTAQQRREASLIDISELLPEDRMKVLRLLFAKIHHVAVSRASANNPSTRAQQQGQRDRSPKPQSSSSGTSSLGIVSPPSRTTLGSSSSAASMAQQSLPPQSASSEVASNNENQALSIHAPFGLSADLPSDLREQQYSSSSSRQANNSSQQQGHYDDQPPQSAGSHGHHHHHHHDHNHGGAAGGPSDIDADSEARIRAYLQAEGAALLGLSQQHGGYGDYSQQHAGVVFGDENADGAGGDVDEDEAAGGNQVETEKLADRLIEAVSEREALSRRLAAEAARGGGRR
jgi:hypothetical protein